MYCGVIVPATERVQPMNNPCATVESAEATVPPKQTATASPAAPGVPVINEPVPMKVELLPAGAMVRQVRLNSRIHGCAVVAPGVVTATTFGPRVAPPVVVPIRGVIIRLPVELNDMIPPAVSFHALPARASFGLIGVNVETAQRPVSLVAVTAVRFASGESELMSAKCDLILFGDFRPIAFNDEVSSAAGAEGDNVIDDKALVLGHADNDS